MADFKEALEELMSYYKDFVDLYINQIKDGPEGTLIHQSNHGKKQFLLVTTDNGKRNRKSITKNTDLLRKLARVEFARKALGVLKPDVALLQSVLDKLKPFEPDRILDSMTNAYKLLPEDFFFDRDAVVTNFNLDDADRTRIERHREWGEQRYEQCELYPEYKNKRSSRGELLRSKSELLIVERLYHYEIPKHYDETIIANGETFYPDFTFQGADGDLFYWEHLGMMNIPKYSSRNIKKLRDYIEAGIIPGNNLILSFDGDGTINMGMIDAIIKNEVIPRL